LKAPLAPHIAHARATVETLARDASRLRRGVTAAMLGPVFDQFTRLLFFPSPPVYALALGENGAGWAALAAASAARRTLVRQSLQPTLAFLGRLGLIVRSRYG